MRNTQLVFARSLWLDCMRELHRRGGDAHESGCFVIGSVQGDRCCAHGCVYYDELDVNAYASGVCILHGEAFPRLWDVCRSRGQTVIADIHTHGGTPDQSEADRTHPMIARHGHFAVIVPHFASGRVWRHHLGLYRYEGSHQWTDLSGWLSRGYLKIKWWA